MKKTFSTLCLAFAVLATPALSLAQTSQTAAQATQQQDAVSTASNGGVTGSNNFTIEASVIPTSTRADVYQRVETSGTTTIKNTPSLGGAQLITSNDTCMGSASVGGAGPGFALQVGTTYTDLDCKRLKASRELWNKGYRAASLAMDCMDAAMREALELTGTQCPQSMTEEARKEAYTLQPQATLAPRHSAPTPVAAATMLTPSQALASATPEVVAANGQGGRVTRAADGSEFIDLRSNPR
jgi:hypothetical protein